MVRNFAPTTAGETHVLTPAEEVTAAQATVAEGWPIWDSKEDFAGQKQPKFQLRYRESRRHASDWEYDPAAEAEAEAAAAARGNGNGNGNGVTAAVVAASSGREGAFAHESAAGGATNYVAEVTTAAAVVNAI